MNTDKRFWIGLTVFWFLIVVICFFPYLFTSLGWFELNFNGTGQIGDTIGGTMGPFIAIAAAILTFLAFWVQYSANERLKNDTATQRFENRFFEMVRIHRENVMVLNSRDSTKRKDLFITMFFELKFIYNYAQNLSKQLADNNSLKEPLSDEAIFNISYILFFSGANPDTTRTENPTLGKIGVYTDLFLKLTEDLRKMREEYRTIKSKKIGLPKTEEGEYKLYNDSELIECSNEVYCFSKSNNYLSLKTPNVENSKPPVFFWLLREPFTGHINELGPYFQHLLQTIKYLDGQEPIIFSSNNASINKRAVEVPEIQFNYFKLLRAQLSTYELLLIYYHALSILGDEWLDKGKKELLKRYKVLKKLPTHYADFYKAPEDELKKEDELGNAMFDEFKLKDKMKAIYDRKSTF